MSEAKNKIEDELSRPAVMRVLTTPDCVGCVSLFEAFMTLPREQRFMIGDGVQVKMGTASGQVRSIFMTKTGHIRYAVEFDTSEGDDETIYTCKPDKLKIRILTK